MVKLFEKDTGEKLGEISEDQLEFLMEHLDEELYDQDYCLTEENVGLFEEAGADPDLVDTLRSLLVDKDEVEISWSQD